MRIPLASPDITQSEIDAVVEVLVSGTLSIGPCVERFERKVAQLTGRKHAVAVSSGTAGLHLCMLASGIGSGDQVLTTPFSFVASANCILYVGATPGFVDIDPVSLNLEASKLEAAITPQTRAVIAVEAFGHPGQLEAIEAICKRRNLTLIEDCCEGFGGFAASRPIGSFGRAGVFGFYPNKQITTGEGGMIVTDDDRFAELCRSLRNQGRDGMGWLSHQRLGYNYRLSEAAAAMGVVQCERLGEMLEARRRVAAEYTTHLIDCPHLTLPSMPDQDRASWFVYVVRLREPLGETHRDEIIRRLRSAGIGCNHYFPPIHLQPYMRERFGFAPGDYPVCEWVSNRTIALPFGSRVSPNDVREVCAVLRALCDEMVERSTRRRAG